MTASSLPTPAVARRRRRIALSILACIAVIAAGLLAYTRGLHDDVVLAGVVASHGDLGFTPMKHGHVQARTRGSHTTTTPSDTPADANEDDAAAASSPNVHASGGVDGTGNGSTAGVGGTSIGGSGSHGLPGSADGTATGAGQAPTGAALTLIDGFRFTVADNMEPGDTSTGSATLRNTGDTATGVRLQVLGTDPYDCFRFTATEFAQQADGSWKQQGTVGSDASPAAGGMLDLGTWAAGGLYRTDVALTLRSSCTVGSGRSSNGSTALADRDPEHATARLDFRFVTGGGAG